MATRHTLRIEHWQPLNDGGWRLTFGCSCDEYTGDDTVGDTQAICRERATEHHQTHARMARTGASSIAATWPF